MQLSVSHTVSLASSIIKLWRHMSLAEICSSRSRAFVQVFLSFDRAEVTSWSVRGRFFATSGPGNLSFILLYSLLRSAGHITNYITLCVVTFGALSNGNHLTSLLGYPLYTHTKYLLFILQIKSVPLNHSLYFNRKLCGLTILRAKIILAEYDP